MPTLLGYDEIHVVSGDAIFAQLAEFTPIHVISHPDRLSDSERDDGQGCATGSDRDGHVAMTQYTSERFQAA